MSDGLLVLFDAIARFHQGKCTVRRKREELWRRAQSPRGGSIMAAPLRAEVRSKHDVRIAPIVSFPLTLRHRPILRSLDERLDVSPACGRVSHHSKRGRGNQANLAIF